MQVQATFKKIIKIDSSYKMCFDLTLIYFETDDEIGRINTASTARGKGVKRENEKKVLRNLEKEDFILRKSFSSPRGEANIR